MLTALHQQVDNRLFKLEQWQRNLWIMFIAQAMSAIGFSAIFPFLPLYVEDLGTHTSLSIEFWAGMVFSAQAITMMIASPLWGAVADRYGRKPMVERAMFGGTIVVFLMAFPRNAEELVLLRAIQGMITGTVAAANALVAASAPRHRTGYAMGVIQVGLWGGVALGPLIGGFLAEAYGFRIPFVITAGLLLLSGILVRYGVKEEFTPQQKSSNQRKSFANEWRHIMTMPGVIQTYGVRFMSGLSRSMLVPITPLFIAFLLTGSATSDALNFPQSTLFSDIMQTTTAGISSYTGLVIGISSATATFSAVYLGRLGDKIGHRRILIVSSLVAMAFFIPQPFVTAPSQLLILQGLSGLAIGGIVSAPSALLAIYTEPGEEGSVYGIDNSVVSAARAVAPLLAAGFAVWFGLRIAFASMAGVFLLVAFVGIVLLPNPKMVQSTSDKTTLQPTQNHAVQPKATGT